MAGTKVQGPLSEAESDEEQPLVPRSTISGLHAIITRCWHINFPYRLLEISEKGAIFVILLNTLIILSASACVLNFVIEPLSLRIVLFSILAGCALLLSPVIALLSECYFGRYKVLQTSLYALLLAIVLIRLTIVTMPISTWYVVCLVLMLSIACYASCIIPFAMDQMVEESGEELTFTFYWITWPSVVCALVHVLITRHQLSNSIKLIVGILNYARKHRHPERRSAFTCWEEECASRIDLGKDKYGGPFTVEQVENVKTVLRLIPLLSCILPVNAMGYANTIDTFTALCRLSHLGFWIHFVSFCIVTTALPIYQFFIYPFLYNYIPSMLRRIGCGMFLIVLSQALVSSVSAYVEVQTHSNRTNTPCPVSEEEQHVPVVNWLLIASRFSTGAGVLIVKCTAVEFVIAQSPYQLRGFVTSVCLGVWGIFNLLGLSSNWFVWDCNIHIALSALSLCLFVLFLFVSKRYKLRQRNEVIPYHMFAENQFEKDYRLRREFLEDQTWMFD